MENNVGESEAVFYLKFFEHPSFGQVAHEIYPSKRKVYSSEISITNVLLLDVFDGCCNRFDPSLDRRLDRNWGAPASHLDCFHWNSSGCQISGRSESVHPIFPNGFPCSSKMGIHIASIKIKIMESVQKRDSHIILTDSHVAWCEGNP